MSLKSLLKCTKRRKEGIKNKMISQQKAKSKRIKRKDKTLKLKQLF